MGRGSKICSYCQESNGPRSFICKKCHKGFVVKGVKQPDIVEVNGQSNKVSNIVNVANSRKQLHNKAVDWKTLEQGSVIRVLSGGPIWPSLDKSKPDIPTGYYGIYAVKRVCDDGLEAYPIKAAGENGLCFIYMGEERIMKSGTIMKPHHIVKVHRREV